MSRTTKDKPGKLVWGDYAQDYIYQDSYRHIWRKTTKPKVRRTKNTEWDWIHGTPSWWNNLFHTRPIRGNFRKFCKLARKTSVERLEEMLEPSDSNKPHKYFY